jgi:hypothetical protein
MHCIQYDINHEQVLQTFQLVFILVKLYYLLISSIHCNDNNSILLVNWRLIEICLGFINNVICFLLSLLESHTLFIILIESSVIEMASWTFC